VAEGIETEAQRAFLAGIGCDEGQGGLFSHPLPPEQLRRKLGLPIPDLRYGLRRGASYASVLP